MKLYEPITIKNVTFKSRIVMAPMCPFGVEAGEDESLGEEILTYYDRRLKGRLGLLITQCFTVVSREVGLRSFGLSGEKQKNDLKRLVKMAHENGTKVIAQIAYPSGGHHRHDTIDFWKKEELQQIEVYVTLIIIYWPVTVIIFLIYHQLPLVLAALFKVCKSDFNVYDINNMVYGYVVFTFVSVPSLSEVFRAGLLSVPKTQIEAAESIGMTPFQAYVHVIVPQVVEAELPVLCTFVTNLIKLTSLAFCMSIREITGEARVAAADSIRYVECYLVIFIMYLILCMIAEQIFKYFERRRKGYLIKA